MSNRHPLRRGFTLLELTLSLALASVLMMAIGSAVVLASRAVPNGRGGPERAVAAAQELDALLSDLQYAARVESRSPTSIEVLVADRNGDGADERIRYAWSGTAGSPLTRSVNGGAPGAVVDDVSRFQLAYTTRSYKLPPTEVQSAERLFFSHNSLLSLSIFSIDANKWPAQFFAPSLPSEALNWRLTRVKFLARQNGSNAGRTRIEVQLADGSWLPNGVVVGETSFLESALTSGFEWTEASFTDFQPIPKYQGACVVFRHLADTYSCDLRFASLSTKLSNAQMDQTINAGKSWSARTLQGMQLYAYGTYGIQAPDQYRHELRDVRVTLEVGGVAGTLLDGSVALLNSPEVSAP